MTCTAPPLHWAGRLATTLPLALSIAIVHPASAQSVILPEGMTIQLETRQEISSKSARVGDPVDLAVAKAVTIGGVTILPAGSPATGEVTRVTDNGLLGRSGKLDIQVGKLKVGEQDVPVRGQRNARGKSGTLGAVGAGIVFLPLAIIVRGKDVKLPAGTVFEVYVDREVQVPAAASGATDPSKAAAPPNEIRTVDPNQVLGASSDGNVEREKSDGI
jgi:hypothetical protein